MKTHTTNYTNTFIEVADDCPATKGEIPPLKGDAQSVAQLQYELVSENPYKYTSDDVLFGVYAKRNGIAENELQTAREAFFSRGQPCLRSSPLTKRYGWGIHSNGEGNIALYGVETSEYKKLAKGTTVKAMRSKRL